MPDPIEFATKWVNAWNARDVEAVLAWYADDVVFTSPTARRVVPESGGVIQGKDALRSYWVRALEGNTELEFTLVGVYSGIDTIVVNYRNQLGDLVNEVAVFMGGLIVVGHATHVRPHE
ncbi:MAG: nuclear transport factor 2 family protein [Actinomycetota bacterium]|nr:nuclear transport factor 2 family protein [Actinomycetota bacterium]MDQ3789243.1 nuclear transport factor 2 family protein [Actinomycetota bacterium]